MDVEFVEVSEEDKKVILDVLGYEVNGEGLVLKKGTKEPVICPYSKEEINFKDASILPWNSHILINYSVLSLSEYLTLLAFKKRGKHGSNIPK